MNKVINSSKTFNQLRVKNWLRDQFLVNCQMIFKTSNFLIRCKVQLEMLLLNNINLITNANKRNYSNHKWAIDIKEKYSSKLFKIQKQLYQRKKKRVKKICNMKVSVRGRILINQKRIDLNRIYKKLLLVHQEKTNKFKI